MPLGGHGAMGASWSMPPSPLGQYKCRSWPQNSIPEHPAIFLLPEHEEGQGWELRGSEGGYIMNKCESKCINNTVKYTRFYEKKACNSCIFLFKCSIIIIYEIIQYLLNYEEPHYIFWSEHKHWILILGSYLNFVQYIFLKDNFFSCLPSSKLVFIVLYIILFSSCV